MQKGLKTAKPTGSSGFQGVEDMGVEPMAFWLPAKTQNLQSPLFIRV
jgi:hypothetical protein